MKSKGLKLITVAMVALLAVWLTACACKVPQEELDAAKLSMDDATAANAHKNPASSDTYKSAEDMYRKAGEQGNANECDEARASALEAKRLAEQAKELAMNNPWPPPPPPPAPVKPVARLTGLSTVYFDFDEYTIRSDQRGYLADNGNKMLNVTGQTVLLEGNCDERGTTDYNIALGQKRADAAKTFLVGMGVASDRLSTVSYGEERPADPGHTEAAWAKNRRVDFVVQ